VSDAMHRIQMILQHFRSDFWMTSAIFTETLQVWVWSGPEGA
jgi:hypothetical protein